MYYYRRHNLFIISLSILYFFFFFNYTATTEIYTLSLHDALPISTVARAQGCGLAGKQGFELRSTRPLVRVGDRKSTRLNSSHGYISYAVFCLKKKNDDNLDRRSEHATSVI